MNFPCPKTGSPLLSPESALSERMATVYRWIEVYAAAQGIEPPHLLSTCRSAEKQRAMQAAWDLGNREGLKVRPATPENSLHVPDAVGICHAFDLANSEQWLRGVGPQVIRQFPDVRWGGSWLPPDYPHFDCNQRMMEVAAIHIG